MENTNTHKFWSVRIEYIQIKNFEFLVPNKCVDENGKIDGTMIGRNFAYRPIVLKNSDVVLGNHYNVKIVEAQSTYLVGEIL